MATATKKPIAKKATATGATKAPTAATQAVSAAAATRAAAPAAKREDATPAPTFALVGAIPARARRRGRRSAYKGLIGGILPLLTEATPAARIGQFANRDTAPSTATSLRRQIREGAFDDVLGDFTRDAVVITHRRDDEIDGKVWASTLYVTLAHLQG